MATAMVLDFAKPHVLRNVRESKAAVAEIDRLLDEDPKRGSDAYERLVLLSVLAEAYEHERYPIDERNGTPQSVVAFMLEQREMTRTCRARCSRTRKTGRRARSMESSPHPIHP